MADSKYAAQVHTVKAEGLLALAGSYSANSPARLTTLVEAQVHATLAVRHAVEPPTIPDEEVDQLLGRLVVNDPYGTPPVPEVEEAVTPAPKPRRTRKAKAAEAPTDEKADTE